MISFYEPKLPIPEPNEDTTRKENYKPVFLIKGFPGGSVVKNLPANAGDAGSIPGLGRSPREENGNPHQYSCLGNSMDSGAWQATVHGVKKESYTTE